MQAVTAGVGRHAGLVGHYLVPPPSAAGGAASQGWVGDDGDAWGQVLDYTVSYLTRTRLL